MQHLFKIFLFLIPFQIATAQQTVTIYGEIHNPGSGKVYIKYLENYLTNDKAYADSALIDQNGNFSMAFPWNKSFPAVFIYGDERTVMFLSPADSMKITVDAKQFYKTIKYENKGAEANNYLAQKSLLFPPQRGSVIFKFEEKVFTQLVDSLHNEEMKNFNEYFSKIKSQSPSVAAFMEYEEAEIKYNWASAKTSYAEAYEYYNHLSTPIVLANDFYGFLKQIPFNNPKAIIASNYRAYVLDYVNSQAEINRKQDTTKDIIQYKEKFIEANFSGELKDLLYAKLVYNLLTQDNDITNGKLYLEKYKATSQNVNYISILDKTLAIVSKLAAGNPAPGFTFPDLNGKMVSLKDFKGKIVYLDIWASWCGPCRMEIPYASKLEEEMKDKDVVFLCVSVDADENAWKKIIKEKELKGVHLLSTGNFESEITKLYNVKGIPHYVIIDKEGKIADSNAKRPSEHVETDLVELLK